MYFVYELIDPRTDAVGYIGITNNPNLRYQQHLEGRDKNDRKNEWLRQIFAEKVKPKMNILEIVDDKKQARERETYWIQHYVAQQIFLTNIQQVKQAKRRVERAKQKVEQKRKDKWLDTSDAIAFCGLPWKGTRFLFLAQEFGLRKRMEGNKAYYKVSDLAEFITWLDQKYPGDRITMHEGNW